MSEHNRIKVMFINHTAIIGGAERSLLDILTFINKEKFHPIFVCFETGDLVNKASKIDGVDVTVISFPDKVLKYNRDKKMMSQILNCFNLFIPLFRFWLFTIKSGAKVMYTNSMKAHFIGLLIGKMSFKKVIWHVRDILDKGLNRKLFVGISRFPDKIICISLSVTNQFAKNKRVRVVHNGICLVEGAEN